MAAVKYKRVPKCMSVFSPKQAEKRPQVWETFND